MKNYMLSLWKNSDKKEKTELFTEDNYREEFEQKKNKTGYDYLKFMCKYIKNTHSSFSSDSNKELTTERVKFIIKQLNNLNISYQIIPFASESYYYDKEKEKKDNLTNVQVFFPSTIKTKKTLFFTAHHDIVNTTGENCQDNSASVCNLIHLCDKINKMKTRKRNIYIVFTDAEECGGRGAKELCKMLKDNKFGKIELEGIIGLELTALGKQLWVESLVEKENSPLLQKIYKLKDDKANPFRTPYNECISIRTQGFDSVCIGILPDKDIKRLKDGESSENWRLCHSDKDTFELSANEKDMTNFVDFLKRFVCE